MCIIRVVYHVIWFLLKNVSTFFLELQPPEISIGGIFVRLEVFTAVTMKNGFFWDVTPCGACKNRRFGGT
jgi:hypothetical protein